MSLSKNAFLLHCLPRGNEVTDEVFMEIDQRFGNKQLIEFTYKNQYYYFA